jgi:uncharacterized protein YdaU (DUF1376 family)
MEIVVHYYHHHIGDFLKATSRLTDAQSMAYLRLLWMYYDSEKPLPDDLDVLAFQVGTDTNTVQLILLSFFKHAQSGDKAVWRHTRCDKEIDEYRKLIQKKSTAGRASAERRSNSSSTPVQQVSNSDPTPVQLTDNQEPVTINQQPIKEKAARGTRLPPELVLPDEWIDFCKQQRPDLVPREVFDSFRDYWIAQPGQKGLKTDWFATWRNWIRNTRVSPNSQSAKQDRKSKLIFGEWDANVIDMENANGQPIPLR